MNNRRIWYSYIALAAALGAGCLGARNIAHGDTPPPAPLFAPASFHFLDPIPADTTDQSMMPAEKVYKNVQTLKGMTAGEFISTMNFMSAALGVRCGFCHVEHNFESDDKPEKKTARGMIHMQEDINSKNFSANTVTCYTCHHGSPHPAAAPSLAQGDWTRYDLWFPPASVRDSALPADAVIDHYITALGGSAALSKITSRVVQAQEVLASGGAANVEIFQKAPNLFRSTSVSTDPKRGTGVEVFDGRTGWMIFANRPPNKATNADLEQLMSQSPLFPAIDLRGSSSVKSLGRARIGDRDMNVLAVMRNPKATERLYFDANTGLLARRYVEFNTPLGGIPFSIDYGDYREMDGVKIPYSVKLVSTRDTWTDTITQLRQNVTVSDTLFARPR